MQEKDIVTISNKSKFFPADFKVLSQPCDKIFVRGNRNLLLQKPRIAIIGSRKATSYGIDATRALASAAARAGAVIVSGLAIGIDGAAHQAAIDSGGDTIAVLPGSLHIIYPASHYHLATRITNNNGLLLTEHNHNERPFPYHFVTRNRLIAALADIVLVVEAGSNSGTGHTVDAGAALGKKIAAVPGNITSPQSDGTNLLLRDGGNDVHIITSPSDLLMLAGLNENLMKSYYQPKNEYEQAILNPLNNQNLSGESLLNYSGLDVQAFNVHITMLEINGAIERSASGAWRLAK